MLALSEGLAARAASEDAITLGEAVARDRETVERRLRAKLDDPVVREAIFVASPSLTSALGAWMEDERSPIGRAAIDPLLRYVLRMAGRPTPFGLFAGCSVGTIADATSLELGPVSRYRRHTRIDVKYLVACADAIGGDPRVQEQLRYHANTSLGTTADQLRYYEVTLDRASRELTYSLVVVERTPYLDAALAGAEATGAGARVESIVEAVRAVDSSLAPAEAHDFVMQMVSSQLLVSDLAPSIYGPDPLEGVVTALRGAPAGAAAVAMVDAARAAMHELDLAPLGVPAERYASVARAVEELPVAPEAGHFLHVDLYKDSPDATLGGATLHEIRRALGVVERVTRHRPNGALLRFAREFLARYGKREVPLVDLLDQERGIPFVSARGFEQDLSPLIADLPPAAEEREEGFGEHESWLLRRVVEHQLSRRIEWALSEADLARFDAFDHGPPPEALALQARIESRSLEALRRGDVRIHVHRVFGPSGAFLLGRFCHGSPEIERAVTEHLRAEESLRPEAIFAELVHLPQGRIGNVVARPALRPHSISYLGSRRPDSEGRIAVDDLRVSVDDEGRLRLRSVSLDREIVPRLTSAHDVERAALPLYRFLAMLQGQAPRGWSWGALDDAPFLPRVRVNKVILSPARWSLETATVAPLVAAARGAGRFVACQRLRETLALPRWVAVVDGDRLLPIDLENIVLIDMLAELAARATTSRLVLQELAPAPDLQAVHGPEGHYVHEIVVPFVRDERVVPPLGRPPPAWTSLQAVLPGGEWLDVSVKCSAADADRILVEVVAPWIAASKAEGHIDEWSFERAPSERRELRIRARANASALWQHVHPALRARLQPWVSGGYVSGTRLETSDALQGRSGVWFPAPLMGKLRSADSASALGIIAATTAQDRWTTCLRALHELLAHCVPDVDERLVTLAPLLRREAQARTSPHLVHAIGARFRRDRATVAPLLGAPLSEIPGGAAIATLSRVVGECGESIRALDEDGRRRFVRSLLCDHTNRVIRSRHRLHQVMLFEYLSRSLRSEKAQRKSR